MTEIQMISIIGGINLALLIGCAIQISRLQRMMGQNFTLRKINALFKTVVVERQGGN